MATLWQVPKLWPNRTVALLAPGPSLNSRDVEAVRRANIPTIAVGDAFRLAPWADMLYQSDGQWWTFHNETALRFHGLKVTQDEGCEYPQVMCVPSSGERGYDADPGKLRNGNNSGYAALHIAVAAGARRGLLLGYDMGGTHFFGEHPAPLRNTAPQAFQRFISNFTELAPILRLMGVEVINCTPGSALQCFKTASLDEALRDYGDGSRQN